MDDKPKPPADAWLTLCVFALALVLIGVGLTAAYSWAIACAALGGILLGVVVLSRLVVRGPAK